MTQAYVCGVYVKQVIFLTVNHCGPLPVRELHSTDETIVWRDPVGSWACLRPVYNYVWIHPSTVICVCGMFVKQVIFLTVNHRGPLPFRELHSTDETIVWRDPGGSWVCLRPISDYKWIHPSRGCRWHRHIDVVFLWSRSFFLRWITVDPSLLGNFTPPTKQ